MDSGNIITLIVLALLILLSAFFSASETSYSTFNRIRMKKIAEGGNKKAVTALKLADDYNSLLSTILVGNNIVNIVATSMATVLFVQLLGNIGATVSTIVMTVVVLIFGEISPKTIAKESPEKFALFAAPILRVFSVILHPINLFFSAWKKLLSRLFKASDGPAITEEELLTMVEEAEQEGAINEEDRTLIENVMEFNDSKVGAIFTPRVDIEAVPADASQDDITALFLKTGYTRLLVYKDNLDKILGAIHLHDYFRAAQKGPVSLQELVTHVVFVTPYAKISDVLKIFQNSKSHMAVVTDEYGGTMGIVTMEDILEELVGEIWDEHDEIVQEIFDCEDGTCQVSGNAYIEDVFEKFGLTGETDATTVNGWIMEQLGRIPADGDFFKYQDVEVSVLKVEHKRIVDSIFKRVPPSDETEAAEEKASE